MEKWMIAAYAIPLYKQTEINEIRSFRKKKE